MAGEVSFKAYLSKESEEKEEVRRFSLDPSVATSFIYLKEKLRSLFTPLVLAQSFDIFWKDSDGDYVTICSDEELTIALTESRNEEVIKVYIRNSKGAPTPVNTTKGVNHDNVFCDGCEGPISGYRYKCLGCRDYDLCATCEARGVHSEHFTLRIPAPLNVRHPFGHRLINKISKAARRAESRCPWNHRYEHNLAADMNNCTTEEATRPQCFRPSSAGARRGSSQSCVDPKECGKTCGTSQDSQATASASITLDPAHIPNLVFNTLADFGIDLASFFPAPPTQPGTSSNQQNTEPKKKAPEANTASTSAAGATTTAPPATAATTTTTGPQTTAPPATNAADSKKGSKRNSLSDEWTLYNPNEAQETVTPAPQPIEIDLEMEISPPTSVVAEPMEVTNKPTKAQEAATSTNLYPNLPTLPKSKYDRLESMDTDTQDILYQVLLGLKHRLREEGWRSESSESEDSVCEVPTDFVVNSKLAKKIVKKLTKGTHFQDGEHIPKKFVKQFKKGKNHAGNQFGDKWTRKFENYNKKGVHFEDGHLPRKLMKKFEHDKMGERLRGGNKFAKKMTKKLEKYNKVGLHFEDGDVPKKLMKTIEKHNRKGHKHFMKHLKHGNNYQ